jgi:nucleotide-binding universal stress UspA family protein
VDGSPQSEQAAQLAAKLAAPAGNSVVVMHVIDAGVSTTIDVSQALSGGVGRVLVNAASEFQAGLIIMGCRGRSHLTSLLLGSIAHDVLQHSHCPVLIAR